MTDADLSRLEALADAATPGPWCIAYGSVHSEPLVVEYMRIERTIPDDAPDAAYEALPRTSVAHVPVVGGDTPTVQGHRDGEFIAASRAAIPALCAAIRAERARTERLVGLLREAREFAMRGFDCDYRGPMRNEIASAIDAELAKGGE